MQPTITDTTSSPASAKPTPLPPAEMQHNFLYFVQKLIWSGAHAIEANVEAQQERDTLHQTLARYRRRVTKQRAEHFLMRRRVAEAEEKIWDFEDDIVLLEELVAKHERRTRKLGGQRDALKEKVRTYEELFGAVVDPI